MIKALLFALLAAPASALEPGSYQLVFRTASDVGQDFKIQIVDVSTKPGTSYPSHGFFNVEVSSLGWYDNEQQYQLVRGSIYDGKFFLVIPEANFMGVRAYSFEGTDKMTDGVYSGTSTVILALKGEAKEGKSYRFGMRKRTR